MTKELLSAMINLRKNMKAPEFARKLDATISAAHKTNKDNMFKFEPSHEEMKQAYNL